MELVEALLAVVRAVSWDHGDGIVEVLKTVFSEHAPFDQGEVAILGPIGFERLPLAGPSIAGEDLLLEARRRGGILSIDDILETKEFPRTRGLMEPHGLRSLLVLPLSETGGVEGWIVLARDYGWAFAGAPLRLLEPFAAMTGLAFARARSLTALHRRFPVLVPASEEAEARDRETHRSGLIGGRGEGTKEETQDQGEGEADGRAASSLPPTGDDPGDPYTGGEAVSAAPRAPLSKRAERRARRRALAEGRPLSGVPGSEPPKAT